MISKLLTPSTMKSLLYLCALALLITMVSSRQKFQRGRRIVRSNTRRESASKETSFDVSELCVLDEVTDTVEAESRARRSADSEYLPNFSEEFIHCLHFALEPESYTKLSNGSVYIPLYSKVLNDSDYLISNGLLYVCADIANRTRRSAANVTAYLDDASDNTFSDEFLHCLHFALEPEFYTKLSNGSVYIPTYSKVLNNSDYFIANDTLYVCQEVTDMDNGTDLLNGTGVDDDFFSKFSEEFLDCMHTGVAPECYIVLPNNSVYVPSYTMIFNDSNYYIDNNTLYICPVFMDKHYEYNVTMTNYTVKFSRSIAIVSIAGIGVSTACILLHVLMFVLVRKMRNLPGFCLFSLCIALLMQYIAFYVHLGLPEEAECFETGMLMYYFFLASFFWMNALSYDVWRSLRMATAKLRLTTDRPMLVRFGMYSLYSWCSPAAIVITAIIVDSSDVDIRYKLIFSVRTCWFNYKPALLVYFALPIFVLLSANILFFISSSLMISSATMKSAENREVLWSRFLVSLRLAVVMGLMWIFGVLATATQAEALWYLYAIFTALQGVFIFFSFTLTEKSRAACKAALKGRKSSTMPTQISSKSSSSHKDTPF